jgi:histidine triad (HIT) family protein
MSEPSIFTRIINREIEGQILFQDAECFVILTHEPLTPGHLMVIPRQQIDHLWDIDDVLYQHLMLVAKKMAFKIREVYDYKRVGMVVEGFGVPHAHIHVFGLDQSFNSTIVEHVAKGNTAVSPEELKIEAQKLTIA